MVKGLFNSLRGEMASTRLAEDKLYEIVLAELKAGDIDEVAKARATVEAEGEEKKADALYIKHRIRRINDEHSANQMAANNLKRRSAPYGKGQQSPTKEADMTEETKMSDLKRNAMLLMLATITVYVVVIFKLAFRYYP